MCNSVANHRCELSLQQLINNKLSFRHTRYSLTNIILCYAIVYMVGRMTGILGTVCWLHSLFYSNEILINTRDVIWSCA